MGWSLFGTKCAVCGSRTRKPVRLGAGRMVCSTCADRAIAEAQALEAQRVAAEALGTSVITKADLGGGVTLDLALIPSGEFLMGSPANEEGRFSNETQHRVRISKPFMMGIYPVTQAQWRAVMGNEPGAFKGDQRPVEMVSWDDAEAFCQELSQKEGKKYRLPAEAEWEYACRAGTETAYYTGDGEQALAEAGWYADNSGNSSIDSARIWQNDLADYAHRLIANECRTHPVGQKKPNAWGLFDMHGNVLEWCSDWYGDSPAADATDPTGPASDTSRVLRGGSWRGDPRHCRAAYRDDFAPYYRDYYIGFRVALDFH